MGYNKGVHSGIGGNHRARLYALMLMLAFGGALLGTMMLHQLREKRVYNLVVKDKGNELLSLQLLLQKENNRNKEIERKNDEMKAKIYALSDQKMELDRKVLKMKSTMNSLKDELKVMESALEEKQNEIRMLQGWGNILGKVGFEKVRALKENLMQKEAKIKELKQHLGISINNATIFPENLTANGTMTAQDKNEETDEHSSESTIYGDVTNDATEFIKFIDGKIIDDDQNQDGKGNNGRYIETYEHGQMQEDRQVEGKSDGGTASKEITNEDTKDDGDAGLAAKYLNGKNTNQSERSSKDSHNVNDGGVARKHSHVSRTKHWRMNSMNMQAKKL